MGRAMREGKRQSPAMDAFDEAIKLGMEERALYPERASFVDLDELTGKDVRDAVDEDRSVVVVDTDGSAYALTPEPIARQLPTAAGAQAATGAGSGAAAK
jgi:hypothetical protein